MLMFSSPLMSSSVVCRNIQNSEVPNQIMFFYQKSNVFRTDSAFFGGNQTEPKVKSQFRRPLAVTHGDGRVTTSRY